MATSASCLLLPTAFSALSINCSTQLQPSSSLSFSSANHNVFSRGCSFSLRKALAPGTNRGLIVCEAKPDSAAKRARQAEKRRLYNKAKKSEVKTRMKKVLEALDGLQKKTDAQPDEVLGIEKLIAEAYSAIDKAVKAGTLHRNTGARRKSRLARRKKAVEIHHGWYTPPTPLVAV
uniref:Small ribosomal subunit protein bS20c n=1 Tax=Kalanchoe fedtschenkoi TaxID=63787 RepID=A0A7N0UPI1_KALFE